MLSEVKEDMFITNEAMRNFSREIESIFKKQKRILKLKNKYLKSNNHCMDLATEWR